MRSNPKLGPPACLPACLPLLPAPCLLCWSSIHVRLLTTSLFPPPGRRLLQGCVFLPLEPPYLIDSLPSLRVPTYRPEMAQPSAKKQSMSEIKLRRLTELNARLREDLDRPRISVSEACEALIAYTKVTKDYMVPSVWGQVGKGEDRKYFSGWLGFFHRASQSDRIHFGGLTSPAYAQQTQQAKGCCGCM